MSFASTDSRKAKPVSASRHPEPLPHSNDLRVRVRDPEGNPRGANLTLASPIRYSMNAYDDRQSSDSLLTGKLYDDSDRRMNPTWAKKGFKRRPEPRSHNFQ